MWVSLGAGILTALPVLSFVFMAQPDNFSLYQPLVAGSLWLAGRALSGRPRAGRDFALAGLLAGVATLSRNDGLLVLAVLGVAFLWDRIRQRQDPVRPRPSASVALFAGGHGALVRCASC